MMIDQIKMAIAPPEAVSEPDPYIQYLIAQLDMICDGCISWAAQRMFLLEPEIPVDHEGPNVQNAVYNLGPFASAILWGALVPAQIGCAYLLWFFFYDSLIETWLWWTYVGGYG